MDLEKKIKICDPLYNYIYFEKYELSLLDHPVFQRLRYIKQLGFSDKAFPSATHTRFTHSLGVCHLAGEAFDSIFEKNKTLLSTEKKRLFRKYLRTAALLHDIGHGPFSHSSESLMPPLKNLNLSKYLKEENRQARHEDYSLKLILEEETLLKVLKDLGLEPSSIAQILHPDFIGGEADFFKDKGLNFLPLLRQILSSPFDVDRMDYLYRDSLFCGVRYGLIDFIWLIAQMSCHIQKNQGKNHSRTQDEDQVFLSIDSSALYTLESLILGRQHMRLVVYFHHKSTIYNEILKKYSKNCDWNLPSQIEDYLKWTDSKLLERLKKDNNKDSNVWAKKITEKKPYLRLYEGPSFVIHSPSFDQDQENQTNFLKGLSLKRPFQNKSHLKDSLEDPLFFLLQKKLTKKKIDFIVADSEKNSINPSKKEQKQSPVFIENRSLDYVQQWDHIKSMLFIPSRTLKRIYVPEEQIPTTKKLLKKVLPVSP